MKQKKTLATLAIALALVGAFTLGAKASSTLQAISAYLDSGITVQYNGETQVMKDAAGARVYPISYNGTTYLPVRAVSDMLGVEVNWDQATKTVQLGGAAAPAKVNLLDTLKPYTKYQTISYAAASRYDGPIFYQNAAKPESIGGETVNSWLQLWTGQSNDGSDGNSRVASFNLGGKYKTLTFKAYTDIDITLTVKGDNDSVLDEFELKGGEVPQTFTVNLLNTTQLTFERGLTPLNSISLPVAAVHTYVFDAILE